VHIIIKNFKYTKNTINFYIAITNEMQKSVSVVYIPTSVNA